MVRRRGGLVPLGARRQVAMDELLEPDRRGVIAWLERKAEAREDVVISARMAEWLAKELRRASA